MVEVNCIQPAAALLGECPRWDVIASQLFWTDIDSKQLWSVALDGRYATHSKLGNKIGSIAIATNSSIMCATDDGIYNAYPFIGPAMYEKVWDYPEPELQQDGGRFNDGCCDPVGRFVVGTMDPAKQGRAGVWSYTAGEAAGRKVLDGFSTFNGLAFTPDGKQAWFTDTPQRKIWRASYDVERGEFGEREEVISFPDDQEPRPDGACFDTAGNYWVAMYAGGCVHCISPVGEILQTYQIPASFTTMPAFAGDGLSQLVVTTGTRGNEEEIARNPQAGGLFMISGLGVTGALQTRYRI